MKTLNCILALILLLAGAMSVRAENRINEVEFDDTGFSDVVRVLSELSQSNIIATSAAMKKQVTIHLKDVSVLDAVKSISRISDLWYRYDDDTDTYRIMTREEYGKDLIVRDSEHIEVFRLLNANVRIVAQAIEDLFGNRVILSLGLPPGQKINANSAGRTGANGGGVRNTRSFNRSSRNNRGASVRGTGGMNGQLMNAGSQIDGDRLTQAQLEQIAELTGGATAVDSQTLQQVTVQAQPIYVTVNNEHNMIIVRTDDQKVISAINKLIDEMDIPIPQVMLEMKILNVTLGEDFNSIFNFELKPSGSNKSLQPIKLGNNALLGSGSFIYEFLNSRLKANIEFLESNNRIKVLSNPMVLASNHREAELFIGEESLLTRGFTFNPAVITNNTVVSPSFIETETELQEIGITLRITPRINADETVTLELEQENSTLNKGGATLPVSDGQGNVIELPIDTVDNARLTGTVLAKDGLTVAVGGLIRTSKSKDEKKVPLLGEIPVIGRVFRSTVESEEETETVLLITPHIITRPQDSEKIRQSDNSYYRGFNQNYPDLPAFGNKFLNRDTAKESIRLIPDAMQNPQYREMTEYAARMIRTPEIERAKSDVYIPVRVLSVASGIFDNPAIKTVPLSSWQHGNLYVTAIGLFNRSDKVVNIEIMDVKGKWEAAALESDRLAMNGDEDATTVLYLISTEPFGDTLIAEN